MTTLAPPRSRAAAFEGSAIPATLPVAPEPGLLWTRALAIASEGQGVLILSPESVAHFYPATPEQLINACYAAGFRAVTRGVIGDELGADADCFVAERSDHDLVPAVRTELPVP